MPKITLTDLVNNYASISQLNDNFDQIETELNDNVLYRSPPSGEPNQMEDTLDLNSNRIINIGKPVGETDAVRLKDVQDLADSITTASFVTYENTTSGLAAEDVQAAIDELEEEIDAVSIGEIDAENVNIEDSGGFYSSVNAEGAFTEIALDLQGHTTNTSNPHSVNKNQVGLANVQNVDTTDAANVDITDSGGNYTATDVEAALAEEADARQTHEVDTNDPHDVQASQVDYDNTTSNLVASDVKAAIDEIVQRKRKRNYIINGEFRIWQRGTSFTTSDVYGADRWKHNFGDGAGTVSRQAFALGQTDVPGEPQYFYRLDQTSAATSNHAVLEQFIEGVRTFAGQTIRVDFWAKADAAKSLVLRPLQNFGTGGSPSSNVGVTPNFRIDLTTSWQRFTTTYDIPSISGKTIGDDGNDFFNLRFLELEAFTTLSTFTFDIANVQVTIGEDLQDFEPRPIGEELQLCQRYYFKTFPSDTDPGQNAGREGDEATVGTSNGEFMININHPVLMRAAPSVTTYNPNAANSDARNLPDGTDTPVVVFGDSNIRSTMIVSSPADSSDANDRMVIHIDADAEL